MIPLSYNYRNLIVRWKTTLITASGFMLVVTAFIVLLAFVSGVQNVCVGSGQPENVIVLKEGASDEVLSQIGEQAVREIELTRGVSAGDDGRPLSSPELFLAVNQWSKAAQQYETIQMRGVLPAATRVHTQIRIPDEKGRFFDRNTREVILGVAAANQLGLERGDELRVAEGTWTVVGIFEADGSVFESEVWCDLDQLAGEFHRRNSYTSVVLRCPDPAAAAGVVRRVNDREAFRVEARTEPEYYREQAEQNEMLRRGAIGIAAFMAVGAVFGVANTMFAAIGERLKDIAVMRLLGFSRSEIVLSFLMEAVCISLVGAIIGSLLGYSVNGLTLSAALGRAASSKSVAFAFQVDAAVMVYAWVFALGMGILGGLLPAMSAMRVGPLEAMR